MSKVKRLTCLVIVLALTLSVFALPTSAATKEYVPRCFYCDSTNLQFIGYEQVLVEVDEHGEHYLTYSVYQCRQCFQKTYIDQRLLT